MSDRAELDRWVEHLDAAARAGAEVRLREGLHPPPPTVHLLCSALEPPYLGFVECRPCDGAADSGAAIAALGLLPAAVGANRLVVCWDEAHLSRTTGESDSGERTEPVLVVVDAWEDGQTVNRYAVREPAPSRSTTPRPDRAVPVSTARLPDPVGRLLAVWRDGGRMGSADEALRVCAALEGAGYRARWVSRRVPASAPAWARTLAPLMR